MVHKQVSRGSRLPNIFFFLGSIRCLKVVMTYDKSISFVHVGTGEQEHVGVSGEQIGVRTSERTSEGVFGDCNRVQGSRQRR